MNHVIYHVLATRNRGYTNEVRVGGLEGFQPTQAAFVSCSRELHSPGATYFLPLFAPIDSKRVRQLTEEW
ncbi:hypothetical protein [Scytonema sp. PCC 10023]|uniref:hypothetical protein n=1 Tax=Scytonema sp. PCC 10023 TaxID=1680591 RepID=UPI0039C6FB84